MQKKYMSHFMRGDGGRRLTVPHRFKKKLELKPTTAAQKG
jgi:hypothetical protein